jgi:hypothetical protein
LYGCFVSFVQLKITRNYVMFRFVYETGYYAYHIISRNKQFFTRNNEIHYASIMRNLRVTEFRWKL